MRGQPAPLLPPPSYLGDQLSVPPQRRLWRNDRGHLRQKLTSEYPSCGDQPTLLICRESQPSSTGCSNTVLLAQVFDPSAAWRDFFDPATATSTNRNGSRPVGISSLDYRWSLKCAGRVHVLRERNRELSSWAPCCPSGVNSWRRLSGLRAPSTHRRLRVNYQSPCRVASVG